MIYTKELFEKFNPLHHVIVEVDCIFRDSSGLIKLIDNSETRKRFATHKGTVVKEPVFRSFPVQNVQPYNFGTQYEIKSGDTVYFGFDALNIVQDPSSPLFIEYSENGLASEVTRYFLGINYRELVACDTGDNIYGLNGYCIGHHPKKEGLHSEILYIPSGDWEKEIFDAVNGKMRAADTSELDLEKMIVKAAPKSYPAWSDRIPYIDTTNVQNGDIVCFPENFAMPLSNKIDGELIAVNVREICAYAKKSDA